MFPPVHEPTRFTQRLQLFQAIETWSARLLGGWLPGIANWEAKHQCALHLWQNLQLARDLRTRLWELRVANPDRFPHADQLERVVRLLARAQHDTAFLAGLFPGLTGSLLEAARRYLAESHPTWDAPTRPLLERAIALHESQLEWAEAFLRDAEDPPAQQGATRRWTTFTTALLQASGLFGDPPSDLPEPPPASGDLLPFPEAKRDPRFTTRLQGFERPDPDDHAAHATWQFLNYAMEMQAAESLGSVLWEADHMPWEFYHDAGRHCHDECRHSRMGEERLLELGHQLSDFPQFTGNYAWRQLYDPARRYGILTAVIEPDAFALKHESYKTYIRQDDTRSAEAILYDIIDETMHVRWGTRWLPELIKAAGLDLPVETVIDECRRAVAENSLSPAQRAFRRSS